MQPYESKPTLPMERLPADYSSVLPSHLGIWRATALQGGCEVIAQLMAAAALG